MKREKYKLSPDATRELMIRLAKRAQELGVELDREALLDITKKDDYMGKPLFTPNKEGS
ncbi:hypothetical protein Thu_47 [Bacillus phage Thurquoise]|uniref:Uncharacterized protein n=1 Tax=Bacillus phage Deep Blue TaxID=1792245 RepID=A0A140HM34_9CAUD|nr:hypothetical protein Blue_224 [Bacillus phage Deep Blue]AMO26046.1 hypothetical protein Blue_224 [Bacillus phage Deep Blue]UXQ88907.1 hypothetical protein Thu_47 [Bacillus phage Thurquoise]